MSLDELNKWIEDSPYTENEEVVLLLRQLQAENDELRTMRGNSVLVPSGKLKELQKEVADLKWANDKLFEELRNGK